MLAAEPFGPLGHALERELEAPERVAGGTSVAFSIASPYGTYQGLAALKRFGRRSACRSPTRASSRRSARSRGEEGIFVEPSSATGSPRCMQLARAEARIDPESSSWWS